MKCLFKWTHTFTFCFHFILHLAKRGRSLSRAALCSGSGTPISITRPHWQSLPADNFSQIFYSIVLLLCNSWGLPSLMWCLTKHPYISRVTRPTSPESFSPLKSHWVGPGIFIRISAPGSPTKAHYCSLHISLENWVESRSLLEKTLLQLLLREGVKN